MGNFARMYRCVVETDLKKNDPQFKIAGRFFCLCLFFEAVLDCHDQTNQDHENATASEQPFNVTDDDERPG